jgi:hypothetical protein
MSQKEIEKAKEDLFKKAHERREAYRSSREGLIEMTESFLEQMNREDKETLDSVFTTVKAMDAQGNIHTSVFPGNAQFDLARFEDAVIYTNMKSRKERLNRIRQVIPEVQDILDNLKHGDLAQHPDLKQYLRELRASIPDRNERELIKKPGESKSKLKP